ncbi:hypothetical protein F5Y08DRAFT_348653 [Xylaria arbuscula]|nr:hypothetical protein F5Y08DRAFT_348653 [Xylaria arbuscula]
MAYKLLFCTAQEAKPFVYQVLQDDGQKNHAPPGNSYLPYYLVQSRNIDAQDHKFIQQLAPGEDFDTDFVGTSIEECGTWAREQMKRNNSIGPVIVTLDAQSAKDHTVILSWYAEKIDGPFLAPGQTVNTWYHFRIPPLKVFRLETDLTMQLESEYFGVLFHRKNELTDENGVFNYDKAKELILQGEGIVRVNDEALEASLR